MNSMAKYIDFDGPLTLKERVELVPSKSRRKNIRKRLTLATSQGGCFYCGTNMWIRGIERHGDPRKEATLEHKVPQVMGGTSYIENLVCSCKDCNNTRGHISHAKFIWIRKQENWKELAAKELTKLHSVNFKKEKEVISRWQNDIAKRNRVARGFIRYQLHLINQYKTFVYI